MSSWWIAVLAFAFALAFAASPTARSQLEDLVQGDRILGHLAEFERIANLPENQGSRAVYLGYNQSADYVLSRLRGETDLDVSVQTLPVSFSVYLETPAFSMVRPTQASFIINTDFLGYLSAGTGVVQAVVNFVRGGCAAADFAAFPGGTIALLNRGPFAAAVNGTVQCAYRDLIDNAVGAGAAGVLVYNPDDFLPMLGGTNDAPVPVFGVSAALAAYILEYRMSGEDVVVQMVSRTEKRTYTTLNIIAETRGGREDSVVVVGSHLDSVPQGAGINDNGSGSATILETALQFGQLPTPVNRVRFAWWAAEEYGLFGSHFYIDNLSEADRANIALNLNFDMIGSPNYIRGVFNGREAAENIRPGCTAIQELFESYFESRGLAYEATPFTGRSDYGPFIEAGIPAGGLFSGAEEKKTVEQRDRYGGSANVALDSCYHLSCDSVSNISPVGIDELSGAAVTILETLAYEPDLRGLLSRGGGARRRM